MEILSCHLFFLTMQNVVEKIHLVSAIIFILITIAVVVIDIVLYINKTDGITISNIVRDWVHREWFVLSFAWGVLAGRFCLIGPEARIEAVDLNVLFALILIMIGAGNLWSLKLPRFSQPLLIAAGIAISLLLFG
jgi:hypothetical protein